MRTREPQERVPWPRIVALLASIAQKASCTSSDGGSASRSLRPPPRRNERDARHVRDRLFPWTPAGDSWTTLLGCNGRMALPDHERLTDWSWHPAPLSEWDGTHRRRER